MRFQVNDPVKFKTPHSTNWQSGKVFAIHEKDGYCLIVIYSPLHGLIGKPPNEVKFPNETNGG